MATAELKAILTGQNAGFNKAIDGADAKMSAFEKRMKSMRSNMAAALGAGAVIGFTKSLVDMASNIKDTADNLTITTDALQALTAKGREYGVENEKMVMALGKLRNAQGEVIKGNKQQTEALAALGISAEEFVGLSPDEAFARVGKAALESKNQIEAFNAINEIFGERIGKSLIATLKDVGAVGMQAVIDGAKNAGQVIDESLIEKADKAGDRLTEMWQQFKNGALVAIDFVRQGFDDLFMAVGIAVDKGIGNLSRFADAVKSGNLKEALSAVKAQLTGEGVGAEIQKQKNDRAATESAAAEKKKTAEIAAREQESQAARAKFTENELKKNREAMEKQNTEQSDFQSGLRKKEADEELAINRRIMEAQNKKQSEYQDALQKRQDQTDEENFQFERDRKNILEKKSEKIASGEIKADTIQKMGGQIGAAAVNLGPMEKQLRVQMELRDLAKKHNDKLDDIARRTGGLPE